MKPWERKEEGKVTGKERNERGRKGMKRKGRKRVLIQGKGRVKNEREVQMKQ